MGIFDNVDLQQILPVAMSAFAGAYDPRSAQALGQSGWNAVQSYMQQQRMDQQREEFQQRQKQLDKELGMREKYLKIAEDDAERKREAQLDEDVYSTRILPKVMKWKEDNPKLEITPSIAWNIAKQEFEAVGRKPNASDFMEKFNKSKMLLGDDGAVLFSLEGDRVRMRSKSTGEPVDLIAGVDEKKMKWLLDHPELIGGVANDLDARGYKNEASALRNVLKQQLGDKNGKQLLDKVKYLEDVETKSFNAYMKANEERFKRGEDGNYPGAPPPPPAKAKPEEYNAWLSEVQKHNARVEKEKADVFAAYESKLRGFAKMVTPAEVNEQKKTVVDPFKPPTGYDAAYKSFLREALAGVGPGASDEQKRDALAWARAATLKAEEEESRPESNEGRRFRRPVSVKPGTEESAGTPAPARVAPAAPAPAATTQRAPSVSELASAQNVATTPRVMSREESAALDEEARISKQRKTELTKQSRLGEIRKYLIDVLGMSYSRADAYIEEIKRNPGKEEEILKRAYSYRK